MNNTEVKQYKEKLLQWINEEKYSPKKALKRVVAGEKIKIDVCLK